MIEVIRILMLAGAWLLAGTLLVAVIVEMPRSVGMVATILLFLAVACVLGRFESKSP
ncbi:MAG: hypothetical protein WAY02_09455 [Burkholderiaceae bacterium]